MTILKEPRFAFENDFVTCFVDTITSNDLLNNVYIVGKLFVKETKDYVLILFCRENGLFQIKNCLKSTVSKKNSVAKAIKNASKCLIFNYLFETPNIDNHKPFDTELFRTCCYKIEKIINKNIDFGVSFFEIQNLYSYKEEDNKKTYDKCKNNAIIKNIIAVIMNNKTVDAIIEEFVQIGLKNDQNLSIFDDLFERSEVVDFLTENKSTTLIEISPKILLSTNKWFYIRDNEIKPIESYIDVFKYILGLNIGINKEDVEWGLGGKNE